MLMNTSDLDIIPSHHTMPSQPQMGNGFDSVLSRFLPLASVSLAH